jgi:carboxylesterase type B
MMQSGSCFSRSQAQTETASLTFASAAGCTDAATALTCLRRQSAGALLDASASFSPGALTHGTSVLPVAPQAAVERGRFARVPIVNGANRDEGRTFAAGYIGWTRAQYEAWVRSSFRADAGAVLARYPWPARSDRFTAAYLAGAVLTDSGAIAGIGGCATLRLTDTFARYTRTYAYEFAARTGPGLTPIPGYVWGAGHAAELAYLFPSFDNGTPIAPTFDAAERQLARNMVQYWGGFVFTGSPNAHGQAAWPRYDRTHRIMSLRPGGESRTISRTAYRSEHRCGFWDSLSG